MLYRVIALLLALVFSGSVLAAPEGVRSSGPANPSWFDLGASQADVSRDPAPTDERPLDDSPGQSQSESAMDPPALMMARPDAKVPSVTMSRPRPYAMAAWRAPYLDGPQRPPCTAFVNA